MVRIAVATQNGGLEDQVSQVFGRCQTYTFVNAEGDEVQGSEVSQNQYANATGGAGIQAAGFVANQGADAVISGNFGPNVASVFNQSGVEIVTASGMTVREAVQSYLDGDLQAVTQATSQPMSGSGGGRGMGRGMARKQPGQGFAGAPQQGQEQEQSSGDERIRNVEERIDSLEGQLDEIHEALKDLKDQK